MLYTISLGIAIFGIILAAVSMLYIVYLLITRKEHDLILMFMWFGIMITWIGLLGMVVS